MKSIRCKVVSLHHVRDAIDFCITTVLKTLGINFNNQTDTTNELTMKGIYSSMQRDEKSFATNRLHYAAKRLTLYSETTRHPGIQITPVTGFQIPCHGTQWITIPIISEIQGVLGWIMDSKARDSRFHKEFPGFRVPQAKISKIPKSVLNYMGRNDKRRANYNAARNRSFRHKSFRYELKQWTYTKISLTSSNVCAPTRETFWVNILRTSSTVYE